MGKVQYITPKPRMKTIYPVDALIYDFAKLG